MLLHLIGCLIVTIVSHSVSIYGIKKSKEWLNERNKVSPGYKNQPMIWFLKHTISFVSRKTHNFLKYTFGKSGHVLVKGALSVKNIINSNESQKYALISELCLETCMSLQFYLGS